MKWSLRWRHNERNNVSNHQPHDCLLNGLFRRRSKKTSKLRVTGLCVWNSPGPVNSPHKGPVTRKMFPFDDVIMIADNMVEVIERRRIRLSEVLIEALRYGSNVKRTSLFHITWHYTDTLSYQTRKRQFFVHYFALTVYRWLIARLQ